MEFPNRKGIAKLAFFLAILVAVVSIGAANGGILADDRSVNISEYEADHSIPSNSFRIFYSEGRDKKNVTDGLTDEEFNESLDEARQNFEDTNISELAPSGVKSLSELTKGSNEEAPRLFAQFGDHIMDSLSETDEIYGVSWKEYQENQFKGLPEWKPHESVVIPNTGYTNRSNRTIKEAHATVVDVVPGAAVHVTADDLNTDIPLCEIPTGDENAPTHDTHTCRPNDQQIEVMLTSERLKEPATSGDVEAVKEALQDYYEETSPSNNVAQGFRFGYLNDEDGELVDGIIESIAERMIRKESGDSTYYSDLAFQPTETIADEGQLQLHFDFRLDNGVLPANETSEPENQTDSSKTPSWDDTDVYQQKQRKTVYYVDSYQYDGKVYGIGQERKVLGDLKAGPSILEYTVQGQQDRYAVNINGSIMATSNKDELSRERPRNYNSRQVSFTEFNGPTATDTISTSQTVTVTLDKGDGEAIDVGNETVWLVHEEITRTVSETATLTDTITKNWQWEKHVQRDYTVSNEVSRDITVRGMATATISENESSATVDVTLTGSRQITFDYSVDDTVRYSWWGPWSDWGVDNSTTYQTDTVGINETKKYRVMGNNPVTIHQTAIRISDNKYHNVVAIDQGGDSSIVTPQEEASTEEFFKSFIWTRGYFGHLGEDKGYVTSDWKAYSRGYVHEVSVYDQNGVHTEDSPILLRMHALSVVDGVQIHSGSSSNIQEGISQSNSDTLDVPGGISLGGYRRSNITSTGIPTSRNVTVNASKPAMYTDFVVRNAPEPIGVFQGMYGSRVATENGPQKLETNIIPYTEPTVKTDYSPSEKILRLEVTAENEPLENREVTVKSPRKSFGTVTTNENGVAEMEMVGGEQSLGVTHLLISVEGDDLDRDLATDPPERYIPPTTVKTTVGAAQILSTMWDLVKQSFLAVPIVILYVLWRNYELGV